MTDDQADPGNRPRQADTEAHQLDSSGASLSILFGEPALAIREGAVAVQPYFADLNLDQVVEAVTRGREEYDLKPFFNTPLRTMDAVAYRHEVLRDLADEALRSCMASFAEGMRDVRQHLAQVGELRHRHQKKAWFLDAAKVYCEAVGQLAEDLAQIELESRALRSFRDYLARYVQSSRFTTLRSESAEVGVALGDVRYCLNIHGNRVKVTRYESQSDYSAEVEGTFERFQQGGAEDYRARFSSSPQMNHVEAAVLDLVAQLFPEAFASLDAYCGRHRDFVDETVGRFDREAQFYVAYVEYVERLSNAGLSFCFPEVSDRSKEIFAREAFDIALANKLAPEGAPVVCNDFELNGPERMIVVTGPNQGGKTTFARMFGQLHHLARIGCLVPGSQARLYLCDELFTHFEREEEVTRLIGKLEDDLTRVHAILEPATADSVVIMNESFTSTTLRDALVLGKAVMEQLVERELLGVYVTFVDELASLNEATVSMVATVAADDPAVRTHKIVRKPADGLAYAEAIAEKYGLTYERLRTRLAA